MQDFRDMELSFYRMKVEEHFLRRYISDLPINAIKSVEEKMRKNIAFAFERIEAQYKSELENVKAGMYDSIF